MSLINISELLNSSMLPCDFWDANGMIINRAITAIDLETGFVESLILSLEGNIQTEGDEVLKRQEQYPAPLLLKCIDPATIDRRRREYWDLQGR